MTLTLLKRTSQALYMICHCFPKIKLQIQISRKLACSTILSFYGSKLQKNIHFPILFPLVQNNLHVRLTRSLRYDTYRKPCVQSNFGSLINLWLSSNFTYALHFLSFSPSLCTLNPSPQMQYVYITRWLYWFLESFLLNMIILDSDAPGFSFLGAWDYIHIDREIACMMYVSTKFL